MKVYLNGETCQLDSGSTLQSFLEDHHLATKQGIAAALNNSVISRQKWSSQELSDNDTILIIGATKGG